VYLAWNARARVAVRKDAAPLAGVRIHAKPGHEYRFRRTSDSFGVLPAGRRDLEALYEPAALDSAESPAVMRDRRNRIWHMPDPADNSGRIVVKKIRIRSMHKRFIQRWRTGRAVKSWNGANELLRRGIPTPRPIAFHQANDPRMDSYYVCEFCRSEGSIRQAFEAFRKGSPTHLGIDAAEWYRSLAVFLNNMHRRGVYFRDLSAGNILVSRGNSITPEFCLIDTARARFHSHAVGIGCRLRDLRRALHPLHWRGRKEFLSIYMQCAGVAFRPGMLWPLARYDLKHFLKDRIRGNKPWFRKRKGRKRRAAYAGDENPGNTSRPLSGGKGT
jgi:tRNA A-37 threonylcarbamoyl transferase component Bud32